MKPAPNAATAAAAPPKPRRPKPPVTPPAPPAPDGRSATLAMELFARAVVDGDLPRAVKDFARALKDSERSVTPGAQPATVQAGLIKAAVQAAAKDIGQQSQQGVLDKLRDEAAGPAAHDFGTKIGATGKEHMKAAAGGNRDVKEDVKESIPTVLSRIERGLTHAGYRAFSSTGNVLLARFAAVAGPMAILGAVVSSAGSGLQVLGTAVKVLAASLAPILLPVFAVIAAAMLRLGDKIFEQVLPAAEKFAKFMFETVLPALYELAEAIAAVIKVVGETVGAAADLYDSGVNATNDAIDEIGSWFGIENASMRGRPTPAAAPAAKPTDTGAGDYSRETGAGGGYEATGAPAVAEAVASGGEAASGASAAGGSELADVLRSMRMSMGPRAQFSGLAQNSRNLQLAAMNTDPLEAKMLQRLDKTLAVMERVEVNTRSKPMGVTW